MSRQSRPRIHRLPQRLDYTLIPAPLDLSLPMMTEKSPLPAIIVTPSSPSGVSDYSIAFLAPPVKPSITERFSESVLSPITSSFTPIHTQVRNTARIFFILALIGFILVAHLVTHRLAIRRPNLEFRVMNTAVDAQNVGGISMDASDASSWFGFRDLWSGGESVDDSTSSTRSESANFVVIETKPSIEEEESDIPAVMTITTDDISSDS